MTNKTGNTGNRCRRLAFAAALSLLAGRPAAAQFSAREGFTADGTARWSFEVAPYLFLPNLDATIGLNNPAGTDISVSQSRPTVAKLLQTLTGAFVGYGLVRHGDWSAELNIVYLAAEVHKTLPPLVPGNPGATLKTTTSGVLVSPGFGYQVLPTDASSKLTLDTRVGFTYNAVSASAAFDHSLFGGVNRSNDFAQPWIGARLAYYPSPDWRLVTDVALNGLGVDGGAMGWNARAAVSYLITDWVDITVGYGATQTRRNAAPDANGQDRSINLLAYGPIMAIGFRF